MTTLSNRALLVSLTISQWSARKFDKAETAALAARHGTPTEVARVNKSLLPFAGTLEAVHKKSGEIRTWYYKNTLPWREATGIIRSEGYLDFVGTFRQQMADWNTLADKFTADYPQLQEASKMMLGSLYKDDDYPDPGTIRERFNIDVAFFPVPSSDDWRISLADTEMDDLRVQIEAKVRESEGVAMKDAWKRVHEVVSRARERLVQPDAVFRNSLIENAVDLCKLLPTLNIADDPDLEQIRQELEGSLCRYAPDTLRAAPDVRSKVAEQMKEIMDKMGAFYGDN